MEGINNKRFIRKIDLSIFLSKVKPHPSPKSYFEQYTIPVNVAATMLYIIAYKYKCIENRVVLDLGCGTGRLGLGAAFLGAKRVIGLDIDKTSIDCAYKTSIKTGFKNKTQWIVSNVKAVRGHFNTVLQNPPFGVQHRKADIKFLKKALEVGDNVFSLHKSLVTNKVLIKKIETSDDKLIPISPSPFIKRVVKESGEKIEGVYAMVMTIPHMFYFHKKNRHKFVIELYFVKKS